VTTALTFVKSIFDIASDPELSTPKKIAQIMFTLSFAIAAIQGAAALGVFFANPVTGAFLAIVLAVSLAYLLMELNTAIAEL